MCTAARLSTKGLNGSQGSDGQLVGREGGVKAAWESQTSRERTVEEDHSLLSREEQCYRPERNRESKVPKTKPTGPELQSDSQDGQSGSEEIEQGQQGSFSD